MAANKQRIDALEREVDQLHVTVMVLVLVVVRDWTEAGRD